MAEFPRTRIRDAERGKSQSRGAQQWITLVGGGALAVYGITRRSPLGVALAAGGGTIALFAAKHKPQRRETQASSTLLINCSQQEVYRFWRDLENLPRFMKRLESVTVLDDLHSRWVALGPMGRTIRWDAEITGEKEDEYIAWSSLPGSDVRMDGIVEFRAAPAGRGTLVCAKLEFLPEEKGSALANFLNKRASFVLRQEMRRLEALLETGEIPTTEGQSHGPRDLITGVMRMADPTQPVRRGSNLREVFEGRRTTA